MLITLGSPPSDAETAAWHAVISAAHVRDLPASVPEPSRAETAGRLRVPPPRARNVHLATTAPDGSYEGVASLLLFDDRESRHTAFLDALVVRPDARRRGVGAALWAAVRAELLAHGRTSVSTVLELGGAGEAFVDSLGFTNVRPLGWYVLRVPRAVDEIPPPALPDGLRFTDWSGAVPEGPAESFARAHEYGAVRDVLMAGPGALLDEWRAGDEERAEGEKGAEGEGSPRAGERPETPGNGGRPGAGERPRGEERPGAGEGPGAGRGPVGERRPGPDVAHVRAAARVMERRGGVVLTAAVLDTTAGDSVVAYTEVVLCDPADTRAVQCDTVVVPAHRGRGLGLAVKRHLLGRLRELHPAVREITTTVADDNASMLAVNQALGYRRERPAGIFRTKL